MSGVEIIEAPLLRVPFESLKRAAKDRKSIVDEAEEAVGSLGSDEPSTSGGKAARLEQLDAMLQRLTSLKRKLAEVSLSEREDAQRCKARLQHIADNGLPSKDGAIAWNKKRLDRIIVDYLLRAGYNRSAQELTAGSKLADLVDEHIFHNAQGILDALAAHDCGPALAWCDENRSKLRKFRSKLEFRLRVQEFVEHVRRGARAEAIAHARAHLAPFAAQHMAELQRAVATLAFGPKTACPAYAPLFADSAWAALRDAFLRDLYRHHNLTPEPLLAIHLQAGLSALKTPLAYQPGCSREDPLHLPAFQALARGLPLAKHVRSHLICAVTKQAMDETNPPMVLPNGYVYSQRAVEAIMARHGGAVVCPKTGQTYAHADLKRAFIA